MIQIHDGLQRLTLDLTELKNSLLSVPVDPEPYVRQLAHTIQALEMKSDRVSSPKPPLDAEEVWARWRMVSHNLEELDAREIRTLCVSKDGNEAPPHHCP